MSEVLLSMDPHPLEAAGRDLARRVVGHSAIVVAGHNADAAAHVALGIGRAVAPIRRVVIADLVGQVAPLEALVTTDDPHGISDCLAYGVSLNKIGHPVGGEGTLFVLRSGTEPVATEEIFRHPQWSRLAAGFREVGALLILVASPDAVGIDALIRHTDGVILVGDSALDGAVPVVGRVSARLLTRVTGGATNAATVDIPQRDTPAPNNKPQRHWGIIVLSGATLLLLVTVWLTRARSAGGDTPATPQGAPTALPIAVAAPAPDPPPAVENPGDSAIAAAYGIEVLAVNTKSGALAELRRLHPLPAATVAPEVEGNGVLWYRVVVGASETDHGADSLLRTLRAAGQIGAATDRLVRLPYAFLVAADRPPAGARRMADSLVTVGITAYVLGQPNGTARVYAGAFATSAQAMFLAPELHAAGMEPHIVYRTGRPE